MLVECVVPHEWSLLQPVQAFIQPADVVRVCLGHEPFRLLHKNGLAQVCLQEGGVYVHLVNFEVLQSGVGQQHV